MSYNYQACHKNAHPNRDAALLEDETEDELLARALEESRRFYNEVEIPRLSGQHENDGYQGIVVDNSRSQDDQFTSPGEVVRVESHGLGATILCPVVGSTWTNHCQAAGNSMCARSATNGNCAVAGTSRNTNCQLPDTCCANFEVPKPSSTVVGTSRLPVHDNTVRNSRFGQGPSNTIGGQRYDNYPVLEPHTTVGDTRGSTSPVPELSNTSDFRNNYENPVSREAAEVTRNSADETGGPLQLFQSVGTSATADGDRDEEALMPPPPIPFKGLDPNGFDFAAGSTWIYPTNIPVRDYQFNIVSNALFKNTLVCLPTGLGKTFIAAVVMYNFYRWFPQGKVIFMAPTKPLVHQQIDSCYNVMGIPKDDTAEMTGTMQPRDRQGAWEQRRVFFLTPQVVMNDLARGACPAELIKCVVIDEAHKAKGNFAYCKVINALLPFNKEFRVLALSATPGSDMDSVNKVIKNLLISNLELRTEQSLDTAPYMHERVVDTIVVKLEGYHKECYERFCEVLERYLRRLMNLHILYGTISSLSKFRLLQVRDKIRNDPPRGLPQSELSNIESDLHVCMSLYQGLESLTLYGLRSFVRWLQNILDSVEWNPVKGRLMRDTDLMDLLQELKDKLGDVDLKEPEPDDSICIVKEDRPHIVSHPKLERMRDVVVSHFQTFEERGESSRVIIFCQYRNTVVEICHVLSKHRPLVKPMTFIGQSSSGKQSKGFTQKQQLMVMKKFRSGRYNTLISTCVGEEGLDIGEVDLIVCFDSHNSPIRLMQRMGRTGRKRQGRIVMLLLEGKEYQKYHQSVSNQARISKGLMNSKKLQFMASSPRMVPEDIHPKCHRMFMTVLRPTSPPPKKKKRNQDLRKLLRRKSGPSPETSIACEDEGTPEDPTDIVPMIDMLPETQFLHTLNKDELRKAFSHETDDDTHALRMDRFLEWQRDNEDTFLVSRSAPAADLMALLQLADSKREKMPQTQTAALASQMNTSDLWGKKKGRGRARPRKQATKPRRPTKKRKLDPPGEEESTGKQVTNNNRLVSLWSNVAATGSSKDVDTVPEVDPVVIVLDDVVGRAEEGHDRDATVKKDPVTHHPGWEEAKAKLDQDWVAIESFHRKFNVWQKAKRSLRSSWEDCTRLLAPFERINTGLRPIPTDLPDPNELVDSMSAKELKNFDISRFLPKTEMVSNAKENCSTLASDHLKQAVRNLAERHPCLSETILANSRTRDFAPSSPENGVVNADHSQKVDNFDCTSQEDFEIDMEGFHLMDKSRHIEQVLNKSGPIPKPKFSLFSQLSLLFNSSGEEQDGEEDASQVIKKEILHPHPNKQFCSQEGKEDREGSILPLGRGRSATVQHTNSQKNMPLGKIVHEVSDLETSPAHGELPKDARVNNSVTLMCPNTPKEVCKELVIELDCDDDILKGNCLTSPCLSRKRKATSGESESCDLGSKSFKLSPKLITTPKKSKRGLQSRGGTSKKEKSWIMSPILGNARLSQSRKNKMPHGPMCSTPKVHRKELFNTLSESRLSIISEEGEPQLSVKGRAKDCGVLNLTTSAQEVILDSIKLNESSILMKPDFHPASKSRQISTNSNPVGCCVKVRDSSIAMSAPPTEIGNPRHNGFGETKKSTPAKPTFDLLGAPFDVSLILTPPDDVVNIAGESDNFKLAAPGEVEQIRPDIQNKSKASAPSKINFELFDESDLLFDDPDSWDLENGDASVKTKVPQHSVGETKSALQSPKCVSKDVEQELGSGASNKRRYIAGKTVANNKKCTQYTVTQLIDMFHTDQHLKGKNDRSITLGSGKNKIATVKVCDTDIGGVENQPENSRPKKPVVNFNIADLSCLDDDNDIFECLIDSEENHKQETLQAEIKSSPSILRKASKALPMPRKSRENLETINADQVVKSVESLVTEDIQSKDTEGNEVYVNGNLSSWIKDFDTESANRWGVTLHSENDTVGHGNLTLLATNINESVCTSGAAKAGNSTMPTEDTVVARNGQGIRDVSTSSDNSIILRKPRKVQNPLNDSSVINTNEAGDNGSTCQLVPGVIDLTGTDSAAEHAVLLISSDEDDFLTQPQLPNRKRKENPVAAASSLASRSLAVKDGVEVRRKKSRKSAKEPLGPHIFINLEAEESMDQVAVSSDDDTLELNEYDASFLDDSDHSLAEPEHDSVDIQAKYLQSVRSPRKGQGQFKLREPRAADHLINVISQADEEEDGSYEEDSFCVDDIASQETQVEDTLEIAEAVLREARRARRDGLQTKRRATPSPSTLHDKTTECSQSPKGAVSKKRRKRILVLSSDSEEEAPNPCNRSKSPTHLVSEVAEFNKPRDKPCSIPKQIRTLARTENVGDAVSRPAKPSTLACQDNAWIEDSEQVNSTSDILHKDPEFSDPIKKVSNTDQPKPRLQVAKQAATILRQIKASTFIRSKGPVEMTTPVKTATKHKLDIPDQVLNPTHVCLPQQKQVQSLHKHIEPPGNTLRTLPTESPQQHHNAPYTAVGKVKEPGPCRNVSVGSNNTETVPECGGESADIGSPRSTVTNIAKEAAPRAEYGRSKAVATLGPVNTGTNYFPSRSSNSGHPAKKSVLNLKVNKGRTVTNKRINTFGTEIQRIPSPSMSAGLSSPLQKTSWCGKRDDPPPREHSSDLTDFSFPISRLSKVPQNPFKSVDSSECLKLLKRTEHKKGGERTKPEPMGVQEYNLHSIDINSWNDDDFDVPCSQKFISVTLDNVTCKEAPAAPFQTILEDVIQKGIEPRIHPSGYPNSSNCLTLTEQMRKASASRLSGMDPANSSLHLPVPHFSDCSNMSGNVPRHLPRVTTNNFCDAGSGSRITAERVPAGNPASEARRRRNKAVRSLQPSFEAEASHLSGDSGTSIAESYSRLLSPEVSPAHQEPGKSDQWQNAQPNRSDNRGPQAPAVETQCPSAGAAIAVGAGTSDDRPASVAVPSSVPVVLASSQTLSSTTEIVTILRSVHKTNVEVVPMGHVHFSVSWRVGIVRVSMSEFRQLSHQLLLHPMTDAFANFTMTYLILECDHVKDVGNYIWSSKSLRTEAQLRKLGTRIIFSQNKGHTAHVLVRLCREEMEKGNGIVIPRIPPQPFQNVMKFYELLPGVNPALAMRLWILFPTLKKFISSCSTVSAIQRIVGVKREYAAKIHDMLYAVAI